MDLQRGMRDKLDKYVNLYGSIDVEMEISGPGVYDFCCFGVDASDKLSDDRYMVFYNQTSSPQSEIIYTNSGNKALFRVNLNSLPMSIQKLVFTVSIDGNTTMGGIYSFLFGLGQNGNNALRLNLSGSDFSQEKAIIAVEIYKKDSWRINAVARGFNGGLGDLLRSYGGEEIGATGANNQPNQYGNNQMNQYGNNQMNQYGNNQMNQYGNNQMNQYGNSQMNQYGNNQPNQYGNNQMNQYGNNQPNQYGNSQLNQYGNNQPNQYGNNQSNQGPTMYGNNQISQPNPYANNPMNQPNPNRYLFGDTQNNQANQNLNYNRNNPINQADPYPGFNRNNPINQADPNPGFNRNNPINQADPNPGFNRNNPINQADPNLGFNRNNPINQPGPAPVQTPQKVNLQKGQKVSLVKGSNGLGEILINLNWKQPKGLFSKPIDLDLGCLYELKDGSKGAIQALGNSFGSLSSAPYISLDGDDRTGASTEGENLRINGRMVSKIKRVLVYTFIYDGIANWKGADGVVTVKCPGSPEIIVHMDEYGSSQTMCAIAMLENVNDTLTVEKIVRFFERHRYMDQAFNWGLTWVKGKKD